MVVFFAGAEITVVALFDAGAPTHIAQAAAVNVRSTAGAAAPTQNVGTGQGIGWFIASEWTDNNGVDGLDIDALWRSVTVTEFQLATAGERPVAPAAGAAAAVDPFEMAVDSILGQFAYGTGHDATAELWVYEHPAVAAPFVQPPNSGNIAIATAGLVPGRSWQRVEQGLQDIRAHGTRV